MLSKAKIKFLQSLQHKKFRQLYHRFVVDGDKTVRELLASHFQVEAIYAEPWWMNKFKTLTQNVAEVHEISSDELQKISAHEKANGVVAVAHIPSPETIFFDPNDFCLALDNISDPGNLGAIIRIADWFGIKSVLCSEGCVDAFNPKVVSSAKGSLFRTQVHYLNLPTFFAAHQPNVYGALLEGESIYNTSLERKGILLIGNEAHGIAPELHPFITHKISIPSFGSAESLNAAVATGIICSEFSRQT